jgi:hypothetical protein
VDGVAKVADVDQVVGDDDVIVPTVRRRDLASQALRHQPRNPDSEAAPRRRGGEHCWPGQPATSTTFHDAEMTLVVSGLKRGVWGARAGTSRRCRPSTPNTRAPPSSALRASRRRPLLSRGPSTSSQARPPQPTAL